MLNKSKPKTPNHLTTTLTTFRFCLAWRPVREYLRPVRPDHHLRTENRNKVGQSAEGGRHQLAVRVLEPKKQGREDIVDQRVSVHRPAVVGEVPKKGETDLGVRNQEHRPQLRHHVLLELFQWENWLEVPTRQFTAWQLFGTEQMREQLLPSDRIHEDEPAEEQGRELETDDTWRELPEEVGEGEEEGFPLCRSVEREVPEEGDHREVGLLEVRLCEHGGQTRQPAHIGQEHLRAGELPERRRLLVRALRQQLGDQQPGGLHVFRPLLLLEFEPLKTFNTGEAPSAVWGDEDGAKAEGAVTAAGHVVEELKSLEQVLETETEGLVGLLPSHH